MMVGKRWGNLLVLLQINWHYWSYCKYPSSIAHTLGTVQTEVIGALKRLICFKMRSVYE